MLLYNVSWSQNGNQNLYSLSLSRRIKRKNEKILCCSSFKIEQHFQIVNKEIEKRFQIADIETNQRFPIADSETEQSFPITGLDLWSGNFAQFLCPRLEYCSVSMSTMRKCCAVSMSTIWKRYEDSISMIRKHCLIFRDL